MTTDYRAMCAELADNLHRYQCWYIEDNGYGLQDLEALLRRADAALAQPKPKPADSEVAELVAWLRERGQERETLHLPGAELSKQLRTAPFLLACAADLLERLSPPQPS